MTENIEKALEFLNLHHQAYFDAQPYADKTEHPTPTIAEHGHKF